MTAKRGTSFTSMLSSSAMLNTTVSFIPAICCALTFSAISSMCCSKLRPAVGMSLIHDLTVSLFGSPSNRTSELERKASFIYSPSVNGFPCFTMQWGMRKLASVAKTLPLFLAVVKTFRELACFPYLDTAPLIDSPVSAWSLKLLSCFVSKCSLTLNVRQTTFSKQTVHTARSLWKTKPQCSAHEGWNARAFVLLSQRGCYHQ